MAGNTSSHPVNQLNDLIFIPLSDGKYGGYKVELLKKKLSHRNKFVICPSCAGIMRDARSSFGENMCESCFPKKEKSTPVESVRETVNKLPCRCPLDTNGCAWTGVIGELETHVCLCEHLLDPCTLVDCGSETELVRRLEMQLHLKEFSTQHLLGRIIKLEEENRKSEQSFVKAFGEIDLIKKENEKAFNEINILTEENANLKVSVFENTFEDEINSLKEENRQAHDSLRVLTKENRKSSKEMKFLTDENASLKEAVFENVRKAELRHNLIGKELHGLQFKISNIKDWFASSGKATGPVFYVKKCKIQVHYVSFYSQFSVKFMRIPGIHDAKLKEVRVTTVFYQILHSLNSKVIFEESRYFNDPLIVNKMGPEIVVIDLNEHVLEYGAKLRLFFDIEDNDSADDVSSKLSLFPSFY